MERIAHRLSSDTCFLWGFGDIYATTDFIPTHKKEQKQRKYHCFLVYYIKCKYSVISSDIIIKKDIEDVNDDEALNIVNS